MNKQKMKRKERRNSNEGGGGMCKEGRKAEGIKKDKSTCL
jgi:hypothetical protein